MSRTSKHAEIERRRKTIAINLQSGLNLTEIAKALGVSKATISSDLKSILGEWKDERIEAAGVYVALSNSRIERAINAIWDKVLKGDLAAISCFRSLQERQASLLGLDAPTRINNRILDMTDEEIQAYIDQAAVEMTEK